MGQRTDEPRGRAAEARGSCAIVHIAARPWNRRDCARHSAVATGTNGRFGDERGRARPSAGLTEVAQTHKRALSAREQIAVQERIDEWERGWRLRRTGGIGNASFGVFE